MTTKLYLVNFATNDDFDCAVDDGVQRMWDGPADMAEPVGIVTTDLDAAAASFKKDVDELYASDDDLKHKPKFHWVKVDDTTWLLMRARNKCEGVMIIRYIGSASNFVSTGVTENGETEN